MEKHYKKPPIIEAVLEFVMEPSVALTSEQFLKIEAALSKRYSIKKELQTTSVSIRPDASVFAEESVKGMKLESADGQYIVQVFRNHFAFSLLAPYPGWNTFLKEAQEVWNLYKKSVKPKTLIRIGLRNLNQIVTKNNSVRMEDYFKLYPHVPNDIKEPVNSFGMRLEIPSPDGNAIVQQGSGPTVNGNASVILDIDIVNEKKMSSSTAEIWEKLEKMHNRRNHLFEAFITPLTRKTFA